MAADSKARGDDPLLQVLRMVAPGTELHESLEHILRARTGALLVVGDSEEVLSLVNGGFRIDAPLHPSAVYELAKMDGAIVLSSHILEMLQPICTRFVIMSQGKIARTLTRQQFDNGLAAGEYTDLTELYLEVTGKNVTL